MLIKIACLREESTHERDNIFQSTHYLYNENVNLLVCTILIPVNKVEPDVHEFYPVWNSIHVKIDSNNVRWARCTESVNDNDDQDNDDAAVHFIRYAL